MYYHVLGIMLGPANYTRVNGTQILMSLYYNIPNQQEHDVGAMKVAPVFFIFLDYKRVGETDIKQVITPNYVRIIIPSLQT